VQAPRLRLQSLAEGEDPDRLAHLVLMMRPEMEMEMEILAKQPGRT